jgi:hypothetical protein
MPGVVQAADPMQRSTCGSTDHRQGVHLYRFTDCSHSRPYDCLTLGEMSCS